MSFDLSRIGQMLRDTREEKGLTLDEISKALVIKKRIISAIESGDWDALPPPVYVKGYVNQYAALLKIVDLLEAEIARVESPPPPEAQGAVRKERAPAGWTPRKTKVMVAVAVGAVALGFFVLQNLPKTSPVAPPAPTAESTDQAVRATPDTPPAQSVETTDQAVQATPDTQAPQVAPPATNEQPAEASPAPAEQGVKPVPEPKKLTIVCQDRTWVRIIIDGLEQKEFMLKPEEVVVLEAKESFDLLIGNAGGVKLFYNGKETGFSGQIGEVKQVRLP